MQLEFYKYQGTGNDFILIDNRKEFFKNDTKLIDRLCDRKFGIGADGLILLENHPHQEIDFKMVYFNADGKESTMCGNGGRCLVHFAHFLGIFKEETHFMAVDGLHAAAVENNEVSLQMQDVSFVKKVSDNAYFTDTGSPHHVAFVDNLVNFPVYANGKEIRNSSLYGKEGSNINFVEVQPKGLFVRTYERGVEDETLSCGTGVTAAALVAYHSKQIIKSPVAIKTLGGSLQISFIPKERGFTNVFLKGPAQQVFKGSITC